jgi:hypothetical protein
MIAMSVHFKQWALIYFEDIRSTRAKAADFQLSFVIQNLL